MKKLLSIALSLCLLLSVALADVTLTKVYKTEDLVSNTFHNGFVTAIGMTGENTVVLKDDGTYEYTKRLMQTAEDGRGGGPRLHLHRHLHEGWRHGRFDVPDGWHRV